MRPPRVVAPSASTFTLDQALLIYRGRDGGAYITSHGVLREGRPELGPGRPLERRELTRLLSTAGLDVGLTGWIPTSMLYVAPSAIAWWRPAAPAPVFFTRGAIGDVARQGTCPQPSLVFAVTGRTWFVWAVAGDERPVPHTILHQAPYFNVYSTGVICEGNVEVPRTLAPSVIGDFERAFFQSRFTHPNAGKLCAYKGGASALWRDLLEGNHERFPDEALLSSQYTLGAAMRKLSAREKDYAD